MPKAAEIDSDPFRLVCDAFALDRQAVTEIEKSVAEAGTAQRKPRSLGHRMDKETIAWLLEDNIPAVRYRTMTELLDEPRAAAAAKKARAAAQQSPELEQILARRSRDGCWYYVDPKTRQPFTDPRQCKNVYYLLAILNICAEFGLDKKDERPARAIDRFLSVLSELDEEEFPQTCQTLQFIRPLTMMGYRRHPQVERLVQHLLTTIRWTMAIRASPPRGSARFVLSRAASLPRCRL